MILKNSSFNVLYSSDLKSTKDFYQKIGAEVIKDQEDKFAAKLGDFEFHFIQDKSEPIEECKYIVETKPRGGSLMFYVEVDDVKKYFELVKDSEGVIKFEPAKRPWDQIEFLFEDPNGYRILFYENL